MNKVKKYFVNELGSYNYNVWKVLYEEMDISQLIEAPEFFKLAQKEFDFFNSNVDRIFRLGSIVKRRKQTLTGCIFLMV